jgi:anti-sigma factor RsiW
MHIREEDLEEYALGLLPPRSVKQVEMHLLVCDRCQDRFTEMDLFVAAMRAACADFRAGKVDVSRNVSSTMKPECPCRSSSPCRWLASLSRSITKTGFLN